MNMRSLLPMLVLAAVATPGAQAASAQVANRGPLQPNAFNALPLGSSMPKGWLLEQLRLQAQGLSGHLDEFWGDLGPQSAWLGGSGEGWERGPYFLDGLVPLAYLTKDAALLAKVKKWMDWVLEHQQPDGAIGPVKNLDWWPNYVMLKALIQYQEASGDARVIPLMEKYFAYQARHLDERPLKEWAIFRWHDEVLSVLWLYNRNGDRALLDLARKLHTQGHDWEAQFADFKTKERVPRAATNLSTHGVNNAMAMKAAGVWWLLTGRSEEHTSLYQMFEALDRYHGQPNGIFSADEHKGQGLRRRDEASPFRWRSFHARSQGLASSRRRDRSAVVSWHGVARFQDARSHGPCQPHHAKPRSDSGARGRQHPPDQRRDSRIGRRLCRHP